MIQCIGSRDASVGNPYCSSVCCKYAVKDAIVALEHEPDLDITIFYMDRRLYGKGFERLYNKARDLGVKFVRCRPARVLRSPDTEDLDLKYVDESGALKHEIFNLVVLATGIVPCSGNTALAAVSNIRLNRYGFVETGMLSPLETTRRGIYVAGAFQGPKSIQDSVISASGAVASVGELLAPARGSIVYEKAYPEELNVDDQPVRIGVFVCRCGKNIGGVVDVASVKEYALSLPDVAFAEENLYSCAQDTQTTLRKAIDEHHLNRIVVAACTPRTHEPLFQETLREAGLNKCLFEMVNIRDQCSWVHAHESDAATAKAKDLLRMAVAKARLIEPLKEERTRVIPSGLVIGGGLSGMCAALSLAEQGFKTYLVEKDVELGGMLRHTYYTLTGEDPQSYLNELITKINNHELITLFLDSRIESVEGFVGDFKTVVRVGSRPEETREIQHGIIIAAPGAVPCEPDEYLYGNNPRVILQGTLERKIGQGEIEAGELDNVVMIQCVGSRDDLHAYCSSICCSQAIKNALKIKEINPNARITILYRDIMTYGFSEDYYSHARELGVRFIRYSPELKPQVREERGKLNVSVYNPLLGKDVVVEPTLLVLSTATEPRENEHLAAVLGVPLSEDGFLLEAHVQLSPVDSHVDGIYICGMAHFPKPLDELISLAKAAAAKAVLLLSKGYVTVDPVRSSIDEGLCFGCGVCEQVCPYKAIRMRKVEKRKRADVIAAACKGCGICASYCPAAAVTMGRFTNAQISAQIAAFGENM
jgi:heterodisulfide reductase subunit A